jgi:protein phosphatase
VPEPERRANTLAIDGGCVFGGYLAAYRFPERTLECVAAERVHFPSPRVTWRGTPGR